MKKNNTKKLLEKIEGKQFLSDKFHSFMNNRSLDTHSLKAIPQSWIKIHFKTYPRFDRISFSNEKIVKGKLNKIIKRRKSIRKFSGLPISKREFFSMLVLSAGITSLGRTFDDSRRSYPSAGARYPLEVYPIILNCEGLKKGLYHYNVKENSLELLLQEDLSGWLVKTTGGEKWIEKAAVVFIITGVLDRTRIKYGDRGYRYSLIEAGHLGQNLCLLATELNLGACPMGGFIDYEVNKMLDIDLQKEFALYLIAIGKI